jgi:hypothetical protein
MIKMLQNEKDARKVSDIAEAVDGHDFSSLSRLLALVAASVNAKVRANFACCVMC